MKDFVDLYRESGLDGRCFFQMPEGTPIIEFPDGNSYMAPVDEETEEIAETTDDFLDRIERSKKIGRNLFREEWKEAEPLPDGWVL